MPSTYAHFRAGQRLRAQLAGAPKAAVEAHPELYNIGLHGPDILFFMNRIIKTMSVRRDTASMKNPGRLFFPLRPKWFAKARGGRKIWPICTACCAILRWMSAAMA